MSPESNDSITELLRRYLGGDRDAAEALFREIFPVLHTIAVRQLDRERYIVPMSPTELINELWLRNLRQGGWSINNREHFYAITAICMRRVLVDLARARLAQSRGAGSVAVPLEDVQAVEASGNNNLEQIVEIGQLMERLEKKDKIAARIVDMRYFAGYTVEEIAKYTGLDERSVRHRWDKASTWLKKQIGN